MKNTIINIKISVNRQNSTSLGEVGSNVNSASFPPFLPPQVANLPHLLQPDLPAAIPDQEGAQTQADHRHLQLGGLWSGVTPDLDPQDLDLDLELVLVS